MNRITIILCAFTFVSTTALAESKIGRDVNVSINEENARQTFVGGASASISAGGATTIGRVNTGVDIADTSIGGSLTVSINRKNARTTIIGFSDINTGVRIR